MSSSTPPVSPRRSAGSRVATIFRKELREIFRDRRTIIGVVVGPLLITPGLFALLGMVTSGQAKKAQTQRYEVGVVGTAVAPGVSEALRGLPNLRLRSVERSETERLIRERVLRAALVVPPDADARLRAARAVPVEILHDGGSETSRNVARLLGRAFEAHGTLLAGRRLRARGLPPDYASPFAVKETPIRGGGSIATLILGQIVPYTLILAAFSGGIYAAFDQVAGEKERGTLETLLVSPASRRDIVLGKFGAVVIVCLVSSVLSLVGLVIPFVSGLKVFGWLTQGGVQFSPTAMLAVLLVMLPLSVLFAGLLLAVSTFARNQKEAQTYLGSLFPVVLVPAVLGMVLGGDTVSWPLALAPILNLSLIIKQALVGSYDPLFIGLAFAASALYAALALVFATRLFENEGVLIKT